MHEVMKVYESHGILMSFSQVLRDEANPYGDTYKVKTFVKLVDFKIGEHTSSEVKLYGPGFFL